MLLIERLSYDSGGLFFKLSIVRCNVVYLCFVQRCRVALATVLVYGVTRSFLLFIVLIPIIHLKNQFLKIHSLTVVSYLIGKEHLGTAYVYRSIGIGGARQF